MRQQTQSGKPIGILFPNELVSALKQVAQDTGVSFPMIVRQACIAFLESKGKDITEIPNPSGRGYRTDLQKLPSIPESSRRPKSVKRKTG